MNSTASRRQSQTLTQPSADLFADTLLSTPRIILTNGVVSNDMLQPFLMLHVDDPCPRSSFRIFPHTTPTSVTGLRGQVNSKVAPLGASG